MVGQVRLGLTHLSAPVFETGLFTSYSTVPYWWVKPESNWQALRRQLLKLLCLPISPFTHINKYLTGSDWPCQCAIPLWATLYIRYGQHTYDYADNFLRYLYWCRRRVRPRNPSQAIDFKSIMYTFHHGGISKSLDGSALPYLQLKATAPIPSSRLYTYIIC